MLVFLGLYFAKRCKYGVFQKNECVHKYCKHNKIEYVTIDGIEVPLNIWLCLPNTNTPILLPCMYSQIFVDDISILTNTNYYVPVQKRFDIQIMNSRCFRMSHIIDVTHNPILPHIPFDIINNKTSYADENSESFYYTDYPVIREFPSERVIPGRYANFTKSVSIKSLEYNDTVKIIRGDADGITYLISYEMPEFRGRSKFNFCNVNDNECEGYWNTYSQSYSQTLFETQCLIAMDQLGVGGYDETTFTFKYKINSEGTDLYVITMYGFSTFNITLNDGVTIDANGHIIMETYPNYEMMTKELSGPNTTAIVTNIYNKNYNTHHLPLFLQFLRVNFLIFPRINLEQHNLTLDDLFLVQHQYIYKHFHTPYQDA